MKPSLTSLRPLRPPPTVLPLPEPIRKYRGDVTGDDRVDITEVLRALNLAVGMSKPSSDETTGADAKGDGVVNIADVITMLRRSVGITKPVEVYYTLLPVLR